MSDIPCCLKIVSDSDGESEGVPLLKRPACGVAFFRGIFINPSCRAKNV